MSLLPLQVVPNTKSRAALGELSDRGLHDIFCSEFGAAGSPSLEQAREHFIVSEAAYAVASYLLQVCVLPVSWVERRGASLDSILLEQTGFTVVVGLW